MKILKLTINTCLECPYCEYDPYYDCARNSGYFCRKIDKQIIDDYELKKRKDKIIPIPNWCPLKEV